MPFWSSETLTRRTKAECLVNPFRKDRIKSAAYELGLANQVFLTSSPSGQRDTLKESEQLGPPLVSLPFS